MAIGKEGQNVRLAAKLVGYKIDIVSEEKLGQEALEHKKEEIAKKEEAVKEEENAKESSS